MQEKPRTGLVDAMPCLYPPTGRIRPEEVLRRKLMRKMETRRERRLATVSPLIRRFS